VKVHLDGAGFGLGAGRAWQGGGFEKSLVETDDDVIKGSRGGFFGGGYFVRCGAWGDAAEVKEEDVTRGEEGDNEKEKEKLEKAEEGAGGLGLFEDFFPSGGRLGVGELFEVLVIEGAGRAGVREPGADFVCAQPEEAGVVEEGKAGVGRVAEILQVIGFEVAEQARAHAQNAGGIFHGPTQGVAGGGEAGSEGIFGHLGGHSGRAGFHIHDRN
jgi:hypothetical protein